MAKPKRLAAGIAIDREIGARIRARRLQLALTQSDLAAALEVTFQMIQKYETGQNALSASMLLRAADFLKLKPHTLLPELSTKPGRAPLPAPRVSRNAIQLIETHVRIRSPELRRRLLAMARRFADES